MTALMNVSVEPQNSNKKLNSNQFYSYSLKSQSHCPSGLQSLYSEWHPLSLDLRLEWGKTSHMEKKKRFSAGVLWMGGLLVS